jgi:RNA polymerase sigma-70 factor (ECF subfamily)
MEEVPAQSLAVVQGADRELIYAELEQEVEEIIASLPPQRMIVFRMNRFEGLRYLEIARALGLSERTVQNHMVLAIKHLAKELPRLRLH